MAEGYSKTNMKLIIQIPCFNEEDILPITLKELPQAIDGIDTIEILIINDGSIDKTVEVALANGAHHVVHHTVNLGLAAAFKSGIDTALGLGADIIVNTDADNQYPGDAIPSLVKPILDQNADMVIGNRQVMEIEEFSPLKKQLQQLGSAVVRYVSGTQVPDAPSGFRAFSRDAAMQMNILTSYSYTLETIIQAGKKNMTLVHVPVQVNPQTRPSRLARGIFHYVRRSATTILHLFLLYEPLKTFTYFSLPFLLVGTILWGRFLIILLMGESARGANIQSILLGSVLILLSFLIFMMGLIGELLATNRRIHEETLYNLKKIRYD